MLPRADFRLLISIAREREREKKTHTEWITKLFTRVKRVEKKNVNKPKHNKKNQPDMNDPFDLVHPILLSLFLSIWVEIDFHPPLSDFHHNHRRRHRWKPLFQSDSFHPPFYLLHTLSRCPLPRPLRRVYTPSLFLHHDRKKKGEYEWIQIREGLKKGKVVFFFPPMLPSKRLGGKKHTTSDPLSLPDCTHTHTRFYLHVRGSYTPRLLYSHFTWKYLIYTFGLRHIDCMTSGLILYISFLFFLFLLFLGHLD